MSEKDTYFVAVKLFLRDEDKLFIFKDRWEDWDLPGGRIKKNEFDTPLEDVVARKVREELGEEVRYTLGEPVVFFRHERKEATGEDVRIFAVGYEAKFKEGEVQLSGNHTEMKWINIHDFNPGSYFTGGWLKGVEKYLAKQTR